ncbi:hypothetical protein BH18ACI4_BH18ACI4_00770 [soil metagenome]
MKRNKVLTVASLFSGCGGFDLGFLQAGFRCVGAFDIDPLVVDVYRTNLKSPATICDLSSDSLDTEALSNLDVLLSGSPCQGFSTAGKRNINDPRNDLLMAAGRIARTFLPRVFIAENVSGVRSGPHRKYWDALNCMLVDAGYRTADLVCEGTKMGVPQIRRRAILLAWRTKKDTEVTIPILKGGTTRSALGSIEEHPNHLVQVLPSNSDLDRIAKRIKCGQKLSNVRGGPRAVHTWDIPEVFGKTTREERILLEAIMRLRRQCRSRQTGDADPVQIRLLRKSIGGPVRELLLKLKHKGYVRLDGPFCDLVHTFNGKFRRLHLDYPSPTVDTRFGDPRYFLHPTENRGLTVREAARIQGFPHSFVFDGPERAQYRMVGNAVPPPLANCLARFVADALI